MIQGGFSYKDQFYKVRQPAHPLLQKDDGLMMALHKRSSATDLVLSVIDDEEVASRCGHERLQYNHRNNYERALPNEVIPLSPQEILELAFGDAEKLATNGGCPLTRKSLYVAVVADCGFMKEFGGSAEEAQAAILTEFNLASEIYERQFNIELGIIEIHLMDTCWDNAASGRVLMKDSNSRWNDKCNQVPSMEDRLSLFSQWQEKLNTTAGIVHLVTGCIESEVVGIAWLNQVCQRKPVQKSRKETVAGTSISALVPNQFAIIAHEIGHNLGAIHDCTGDTCSDCDPNNPQNCKCCTCGNACDCRGKFVMSPESGGRNVTVFSPCSYKEICQKMPILASKCLKDPGSMRTINEGGVCGDGIKDPGEECDCGEKCDKDDCCTPQCKLRAGAQCSDANDKCCNKCKLAPSGNVCHVALDKCQKNAVCDGKRPECPKSQFVPDLEVCSLDLEDAPFNRGQCASGTCTNRDIQCLALGKRLGITGQCTFFPNTCKMTCAREDGSCISVDANFLDGTRCGEDGICTNGVCSESDMMGFLKRNKYVLIALGTGFLLMLIVIFIKWAVTKRRAAHSHGIQQHSNFYRSHRQE